MTNTANKFTTGVIIQRYNDPEQLKVLNRPKKMNIEQRVEQKTALFSEEALHSLEKTVSNTIKDNFNEELPEYESGAEYSLDYRNKNALSEKITVQKYWRLIFVVVFILSKFFLLLAVYFYIKYKDIQFENQRLQYQIETERLQ